ncbi:uncharacterized protein LOC107039474 [Diachasma alloeum]|uniref:uncharacterized protein LOC107039474 n=1 Tax=Diachasma alloeum TaxID=454923 RepID=UPI0007382D69|nr:uncharacterized protein LOC107039474 [Diachasma alloeum]
MRREFYMAIANLMFLGTVSAGDCQISIYDAVSLGNRAIVDDSDSGSTSITNRWEETYDLKFQVRYDFGWGTAVKRVKGALCDKKKSDVPPLRTFIGKLLTEVTGLSNCWEWQYDRTGKGSRQVTLPCDNVENQLIQSGGETNMVIALVDRDGVGFGEYTGTLVKK